MKIKDKDLAGRIGRIDTRRGSIETPYLFPVVDPYRQEVPIETIKKIGFEAVITNAYIAYKKGWRNDIRRLLGSDDLIVMTDSGAYQLLEYGEIEATNVEIIEAQKKLDTDIGVILDVPTGDTLDREEAEYTVIETLRRAREGLEYIDDKRLWVLPIQGGIHLDLVERSARESVKLYYDIYALGSPTLLMEKYRYDLVLSMIQKARKHVPPEKPLHLFGAGHAMMIPFAVAMGIDLFDSASYILFARDDRYMIDEGTVKLERLEYFPCNCPVCSRYDPQDLKEMSKKERTKLLAIHNLYTLKRILEKTKQYIREGRLWELLEQHSRMHPRLKDAMDLVISQGKWIEEYTPRIKTSRQAIRIYDLVSAENPIIKRAKRYVEEKYTPPPGLTSLHIKPYSQILEEPHEDEHIVYYAPIIGLVPHDIKLARPYNKLIFPRKIGGEEALHLAEKIYNYLSKHSQSYNRARITVCDDHLELYEHLSRMLKEIRAFLEKTHCDF